MAGVDAAAWMESFKEYLEPVAKMALDVKDKVSEKQSSMFRLCTHLAVLRTRLYPDRVAERCVCSF